MRFEVQERTTHARPAVFAASRDRLEQIVAYLEGVERVDLRSRARSAGGHEEQTYRWYGTSAALPALIRPLIPPSLLSWQQHTVWDVSRWTATWHIHVPGLGEAVQSRGTNVYHEDGAGCRIDLEGEFEFHPERVPELKGVPQAAVPMLEKFMVSLIVPLVKRSGEAVARYLTEQAKR